MTWAPEVTCHVTHLMGSWARSQVSSYQFSLVVITGERIRGSVECMTLICPRESPGRGP
jgi:hypothetical protein